MNEVEGVGGEEGVGAESVVRKLLSEISFVDPFARVKRDQNFVVPVSFASAVSERSHRETELMFGPFRSDKRVTTTT